MDKTILNKIKVNIEASTKLDVALKFICDTLSSEISGYDWVGFYFHNEKTEELNLLVFSGLPTLHTKIPFGKGICGRTAKSNEAYISADVSKESNYISCNIGVKSEIVVPIFNNKKVNIGQIDIDSNNINHFSKSDLIFLETINNFISKKFFK